jgi:hypothetical protein
MALPFSTHPSATSAQEARKAQRDFFATKFGLADGEPGQFLTLESKPGVHSRGLQQVLVEVGSWLG